tara:strand:- start:1182 stop:1607 length:426 start_codon:yes stop_codon:yes gene_type:complete
MTSTLKVNTLTGVSTAGSIAVTGEGNSTTTNLQQGLAKGFAAFNQASVTDSYNHSSCTDVGTGNYHPNLTNNMGVAEGYAVAISGNEDSGTGPQSDRITHMERSSASVGTSSYKIVVNDLVSSFTVRDNGLVTTSIVGDLA